MRKKVVSIRRRSCCATTSLPCPEPPWRAWISKRIENYFRVVLQRDAPEIPDADGWRRILRNMDLLAESGPATVAGLLLFGTNPNRRLPQAGITAAAFPRRDKEL